jgi:Domain of unknown function (DUF4961)
MKASMKKTIAMLFLPLALSFQAAWAQKVWTDPVVVTDPSAPVTIYIDLTKMDCSKLVGYAGPLYIWTWMPGDPVGGNGQWSSSNPDHVWTNVSPDIWSITMTPTDYYGVSAQDVYDKDIFFLAKALDGGGGGDCSAAGNEWKTEDLSVSVDPPGALVRKVFSFPDVHDGDSLSLRSDDVFTLRYDNAMEEKVSMQNAGDLYVYARAYDTDGTEYKPSPISQVGSNPALKMVKDGSNYSWSIFPGKLFSIPSGKTLNYVRLQIMKPVVATSDDAVDGLHEFYFRCN